jgi:WD40 repeat protein
MQLQHRLRCALSTHSAPLRTHACTCVGHAVDALQSGRVNLWDLETCEKKEPLDPKAKFVTSVAFSPDGRYLACGEGVLEYSFE